MKTQDGFEIQVTRTDDGGAVVQVSDDDALELSAADWAKFKAMVAAS